METSVTQSSNQLQFDKLKSTTSKLKQKSESSKNSIEEMKRYFPGLYAGKSSSSSVVPNTDIQSEIKIDNNRKRLYNASRDFQAIFIGQMLKAMRKNLNPEADPLFGGNRQKIFQDMLYDQYAKKLSSDNRFTLADQIYNQLSPSLGKVKQDTTEKEEFGLSTVEQAQQKYSTDRMKREIRQSNNRLSTDQLFREEDWRP